MAETNDAAGFPTPIQWVDDESPYVAVDHFSLLQNDGHTLLVFGHLSPPLLIGSEEDRLRKIRRLEEIPIHIRGRYVLDKQSLEALRDLLNNAVNPKGENQVG